MALVGGGAAMAAVAWVAVLLSPASQPSGLRSTRPPANASLTTLTGTQGVFPGSDVAARRSIVELVATTAHGDVPLIGTAVAAGGLVVTAANAAGVRQLVAVTADGARLAAEVLATDGGSDVALVGAPQGRPG